MSDAGKYRVVFKGEIVPGAKLEEVQVRLSRLFKMDAAQSAKLFDGRPKVIKKAADEAACRKLQAAFRQAGALCTIEPERPAAPAPAASPARTVQPQPPAAAGPPPAPPGPPAGQPYRYCRACGGVLTPGAADCPHCGSALHKPVSKAALLLLTFFLGGLGAHKFYLGKYIQGALYLLFAWTLIPGLVAFVEFLVYIFTNEERLRAKYSARGSIPVIVVLLGAGLFIGIAIIGILAAIAIPNFIAYRNRAYRQAVINELQQVQIAQEDYYARNGRYTQHLEDLDYTPSDPAVEIQIVQADETCFEAAGRREGLQDSIRIDCRGFSQNSSERGPPADTRGRPGRQAI